MKELTVHGWRLCCATARCGIGHRTASLVLMLLVVCLMQVGHAQRRNRGIMPADLFSGAAFAGPQGAVLAVKLSLVLVMIGYQSYFGHRPAPVAIYFDMAAATAIIGASVVLVRGWI